MTASTSPCASWIQPTYSPSLFVCRQLPPHVGRRPRFDDRAAGAEQHDVDRVADAFLVALERRPRALDVDAHGTRCELRLDLRGVAPREAEGREQAERDRVAVRQVEVGGSLERVRERVTEVEEAPRPVVVRVAQTE